MNKKGFPVEIIVIIGVILFILLLFIAFMMSQQPGDEGDGEDGGGVEEPCGNGTCDEDEGETYETCPQDCAAPPGDDGGGENGGDGGEDETNGENGEDGNGENGDGEDGGNGDGEEETPPELDGTCRSGPDYVPRSKFLWKWIEIGPDFCDADNPEGVFCDGTQFMVSFVNKLETFEDSGEDDDYFDDWKVLLKRTDLVSDWRDDFVNWYVNNAFADTSTFFKDETDGFWRKFSDEQKFLITTTNITKPGKYRVVVENPSSNLEEITKISFELVEETGIYDAFNWIPLEGRLGLSDEGSGAFERGNYGAKFSSSENFSFGENYLIAPQQNGGTGRYNTTLSMGESVKELNSGERRGNLLTISMEPISGVYTNIEFVFSPALADPLLVKGISNAQGADKIKFRYNAFEGLNEIMRDGSLITWSPVGECADFTGKNEVKTDMFRLDGVETYYELEFDRSDITEEDRTTGDVFMQTVFYSPISTHTPESKLKVRGLLEGGTTQENALGFVAESSTASEPVQSLQLNGISEMLHNNLNDKIAYVEQIFKLVEEGIVCISSTETENEFKQKFMWVEEKLFETLSDQIGEAEQVCPTVPEDEEEPEETILAPFSSAEGAIEFPEVKLTSASLPDLLDTNWSIKWAGKDYGRHFKEEIIVTVDALFDSAPLATPADLEAEIGEGGISYNANLGAGIPVFESSTGTQKFTDGENDEIKIPFFGEEYLVMEADKENGIVKLMKEEEKHTLLEGEEITALAGKGDISDQQVSVKFDSIIVDPLKVIAGGFGAAAYGAQIVLKDEQENQVETVTFVPGQFLNEEFEALKTQVYVEAIAADKVTLIVGSKLITLRNGQGYPYIAAYANDESDYVVNFTYSSNGDLIEQITISNSLERWKNVESKNPPLYAPFEQALTQTGKTGSKQALFLASASEGTVGRDFFRVIFDGFAVDPDNTETTVSFLANSLTFTDSNDKQHQIPYHIELSKNTSGDTTFTFDGQTIHYIANFGPVTVNNDNYDGYAFFSDTEISDVPHGDRIYYREGEANSQTVELQGNEITVKYTLFADSDGAEGDLYLLLDKDTSFSTKSASTIRLSGTDKSENNEMEVDYYTPNTTDFGGGVDDDYFVAEFAVRTTKEERNSSVNVFIDTTTDLPVVPAAELSNYTQSVYHRSGEVGYREVAFGMDADDSTDSLHSIAYTDLGETLELKEDGSFVMTTPQTAKQVVLRVATTKTITETGAEELEVDEGESVTTTDGTQLTVNEINFTEFCNDDDELNFTDVTADVTFGSDDLTLMLDQTIYTSTGNTLTFDTLVTNGSCVNGAISIITEETAHIKVGGTVTYENEILLTSGETFTEQE